MTTLITEEAVLHALSFVQEPDLGQDLVTLKMIENVQIDGLTVSFTVVLTTPACPLKQLIHDACERAVHTMVDKDANVVITMTSRVTTLRQDLERAVKDENYEGAANLRDQIKQIENQLSN